MITPLTWTRMIGILEEHHPEVMPLVSADPFALVLWEQVAYLATDDVRLAAFRELEKHTALKPESILAMPVKDLEKIALRGGSIAWKERAERMRASSKSAKTLAGLGDRPIAEARKRLKKFAMIGGPGADRILLFAKLFPVFALESNGLRVLMRMGFGREEGDYNANYRGVMEAIAPLLPKDFGTLIRSHQLLRAHGLTICKRSAPRCGTCALLPHCRYGRSAPTKE